jgi:hypothetical protein
MFQVDQYIILRFSSSLRGDILKTIFLLLNINNKVSNLTRTLQSSLFLEVAFLPMF